jgi:hypothetical protein
MTKIIRLKDLQWLKKLAEKEIVSEYWRYPCSPQLKAGYKKKLERLRSI